MHVLYVNQMFHYRRPSKCKHHVNQSKCKIYKVPAETFYHMTYSTNHFVRTV